jgi:hypothetical protein
MHGTRSWYNNRKCRCDACRQANNRYKLTRQSYFRYYRATGNTPHGLEGVWNDHGKKVTYSWYCCRCDACYQAAHDAWWGDDAAWRKYYGHQSLEEREENIDTAN